MTASVAPRANRTRGLIRFALTLLVFGVAGYGVGYLAADVIAPEQFAAIGLTWIDAFALLLALMMLVTSATAIWAARNGHALSRLLNTEDAAGPAEIADARLQGIILILSAVLMTLPPVMAATGLEPLIGLVAIGVLLVVHCILNWRLFRRCDELLRRTMVETCAATFAIGQLALFGWAAAGRLGLAPPIDAWDVYVVLMGLYLTTAMIVTTRRGLA
jgi:hypothetical protein